MLVIVWTAVVTAGMLDTRATNELGAIAGAGPAAVAPAPPSSAAEAGVVISECAVADTACDSAAVSAARGRPPPLSLAADMSNAHEAGDPRWPPQKKNRRRHCALGGVAAQ